MRPSLDARPGDVVSSTSCVGLTSVSCNVTA
jgi:hypothetical protein